MIWIKIGAGMMFLGVVLGAFGAHGLKERLTEELRQVYQTGVLYHLIHGLGILLVGWLGTIKPDNAFVRCAGWAFVVGIVLFSGSLYLLSVTGIKKLGIVTPFGGVAFLLGWILLALGL